jgi:hypothetical protein
MKKEWTEPTMKKMDIEETALDPFGPPDATAVGSDPVGS